MRFWWSIWSCGVRRMSIKWIHIAWMEMKLDFTPYFANQRKYTMLSFLLKFCFKCIWFVWFYIFPLSCNITNLSNLGTRTVYVAPDTAVYCQCFMPMDVFHDVEKKLSLLLGSTECILFSFHVYITLKTPLELYRQQLLSSRWVTCM